jgi:hypothetical protein
MAGALGNGRDMAGDGRGFSSVEANDTDIQNFVAIHLIK